MALWKPTTDVTHTVSILYTYIGNGVHKRSPGFKLGTLWFMSPYIMWYYDKFVQKFNLVISSVITKCTEMYAITTETLPLCCQSTYFSPTRLQHRNTMHYHI